MKTAGKETNQEINIGQIPAEQMKGSDVDKAYAKGEESTNISKDAEGQ